MSVRVWRTAMHNGTRGRNGLLKVLEYRRQEQRRCQIAVGQAAGAMIMLLRESTRARALELPRADALGTWAGTALEAHFRRALLRAEEVVGDGGAPREVDVLRVCEAKEKSIARGPVALWRGQLRGDVGEAVHMLDMEVASALVDALLGSAATTAGRTLTSVDRAILSEWAAQLSSSLLGPVLDAGARDTLRVESHADSPVPSSGDGCVEALFRVRANGVSGELAIWLPTGAALRLAGSAAQPRRAREVMDEQLQSARVDVQARLITTTLSLADVASLRPGDILALDVAPGDSAELLVNGSSKFVGKAGFMDGRLAFQISGRIDSPTA